MDSYQHQRSAFEGTSTSAALTHRKEFTASAERKLRVLMVGMHRTKTRGGITTLTSAILESNLRTEFDFTYIAAQAEELGKFGKIRLAAIAALRFVAVCLRGEADLAYIHIGSNASLYRESVFVLLARLFGRPVITHFHAGDIAHYYPRQPAIGKYFIRTAIGMSDRVIAVSDESAGQLRELNDKLPISLIPNAIDTSAFRSQTLSSRVTHDEAINLLFVGAVGKLKGENDLVRAIAMLHADGFNIRASFLGYGAEGMAGYCAQLGVIDLIDHLGPVSLEERYAFYARADIFVLPSYGEAMPVSLIEAMAAGLAIVTTNVGGIPELIDDGKEGFLVPCGDVRALAERLRFLTMNSETRHQMGTNARQRCSKQADFPAYLGRIREEIMTTSGLHTQL